MLLSSAKFQSKAEEVVREGLDKPVKLEIVQKHLTGSESIEHVQLDGPKADAGGMMLYTSGTTSRPVCSIRPASIFAKRSSSERRAPAGLGHHSTKPISPTSLELHSLRSPSTRSPPPSHSRHYQRPPYAPLRRFLHRISLPFQRQRRMGPPSHTLPPRIRQPQETAHHIPHRRTHHLQPPLILSLRTQIPNARSLEGSFIALQPPPKHLRLCCTTYTHKDRMVRAQQRQCTPRTLRHDRSRHGAVLRS